MSLIPSTSELINADNLLAQGAIRQGMKVADLGCGTTGHFIFPAAELVGSDGIVYAVDIQKSVLSGIESRKKMEGVENVKAVWADIERSGGVRIDASSLDLVLLVNNLFMAKEKSVLAKEILRLMAPGARLIVADWKTTRVPFGPAVSDRVSAEEAERLFTASGFELEKEFDAGKFHYGLVFKKV
ncbi:class I SAM-dependent methyltransferase [Patescibacteria group bacterium]|nr:class I SAM-dependent methyltransferase [Patescibacteria group bacterium]MBU1921665.1 class I SAM-dependent methyltransferase [Patescibacteria group bacterium]